MLKKIGLPLGILLVAVLATRWLLSLREEPATTAPEERKALVEVQVLERQDARITVASQGTVTARTQSDLIAEVGGTVVQVAPAFVVGGFFRKGDVLVELDPQNLEAAASRAEAAVAAAESALALERGQADVARREWERMTAEQRGRLRAEDLYLRKPQTAEAEARLASARADLTDARNDLRHTRIEAPFDGLLNEKTTDLGQFLNPGTKIGSLFAVDYAEVRLPIPETKLPFLELPGSLVAGGSAAGSGIDVLLYSQLGDRRFEWPGALTRTEGVLDTRTRTLYSVVQIADPYGLYGARYPQPLLIGSYVNAEIAGRLLEDVYVIPRHTLEAGDLVWVADGEDRLRGRPVSVVTANGDFAYVADGFIPGDRLVLTRLESPLNGLAVQAQTLQPTLD
jgi:RND family efflux transporter MFP subunit